MCFIEIIFSFTVAVLISSLTFGYILLCRRRLGSLRFVYIEDLTNEGYLPQVRYAVEEEVVSLDGFHSETNGSLDIVPEYETPNNDDDLSLDEIFPSNFNFSDEEIEEILESLGFPVGASALSDNAEPLYHELE